MKKRIACFICSLNSGGAEHQIVELSRLLVSQYEVSLVTFSDVCDHYLVDSRITRICLAQKQTKWRKIIAIFNYFVFAKLDCVISFGQRENVFVLIPLLFRRRVKMIAGERNLTYGKPTLFENVLLNFLYRRANYIVPNSYSQEKYLVARKPSLASKIVTITNYTNLGLFNITNMSSFQNSYLKLGVFCRYNEQKNCLRFAEVIKILKNKYSKKFKIYWYGNQMTKDGNLNSYYVDFAKLVEKYNISDVLILNDHVKNVPEILQRIDATCLPSIFEGFSNSLSEAICCGKPVLASNVSDNSIMVKDSVNGFLFNPLDINDMVNAFLKFFALTIEERTLMGLNSRKIAEELFDEKIFRSKYTYLIEC